MEKLKKIKTKNIKTLIVLQCDNELSTTHAIKSLKQNLPNNKISLTGLYCKRDKTNSQWYKYLPDTLSKFKINRFQNIWIQISVFMVKKNSNSNKV